MAPIWKEKVKTFGTGDLDPCEVILVRVASLRFRFATTKHLRECIQYYEAKTRPSSKIPAKVIAADLGFDWRKLRGWM